jgi:mRNA-degrading endonuclease toxin of MazEF toxin-antitoxin module
VLADQVKSLDWKARKAALIDTLPAEVLDEVLSKVRALL